MTISGVPIFPSGIVKQYNCPIPFYDTIDLSSFSYEKYKGSTKLRTEKFVNILLDPSLKDIATWIEMQAKDYLDNELGLEYEDFFFSESWININGKGGEQTGSQSFQLNYQWDILFEIIRWSSPS